MNCMLMNQLKTNRNLLVTVIAAAFIGSAATLLTAGSMDPPPKLATVDPGALVAEHLQSINTGMDEGAIQAQSQAYAKRLDAAIAQVARQYQVAVLVKPSVITGVPDLTDAVRRRVNEQTR